jgi:hypothetical protein
VDEGDKLSAMAGSIAVVQPSRMESLSIVTLEAFSVGSPVIATAHSRVLADHCRKANAGLYYGDFEEFEEVLTLLLNDRNLARSLGRNGQSYVKDNYGWNRLLPKYELVFRSSARPAREPRGARGRAPVPAAEPEASHEHEPHEQPGEAEDVGTGDLPLLEPEPEPEPEDVSVEDTVADEYSELRENDMDGPPETPLEEPYHEPEPEPAPMETASSSAAEVVEQPRDESTPPEDGELPAFYRPRQRPVTKAPEPAKED